MFTNLKRVFNFALVDFFRNKGISIAAIFVLTTTILLITGLFFMHGVSNFLISTIQNKIDITAYFKADVPEQDILNAKDGILKISSEVKNVEYISKEDALYDFTQKHGDDPTISGALQEVGGNPFLPSLNIIMASGASGYEKVATILLGDQFIDLIEKVDFSQKKVTIEKIFSISATINKFGLILAVILFLVAIVVVFNTIKLAINGSREEITTMRIVGASSWFIKSPFIIQGAMFGFVSFIICFFVTFILAFLVSSSVEIIMPGFNLFKYFTSNIFIIILIQLGFGVAMGVVSSFIVVNKYLKV